MAYPHERSYVPEVPQKPSTWTRLKQWFTHRECTLCGKSSHKKGMKYWGPYLGRWQHEKCWLKEIQEDRLEQEKHEYKKLVKEEKLRLRAQKQARQELEETVEL